MRILISKKPETIAREVGADVYRDHLGLLQSAPDSYYLTEMVTDWGMDNGRFKCMDFDTFDWDITEWDKDAFIKLLYRGASNLSTCKFVCVPDVLFNARATTKDFWQWLPFIRNLGYPPAYAIQDGVTLDMIPWGACDALFIGGTNRLKFSRKLAHIVRIAKHLGLYVHWGRASTPKFINHARSIGCDSIDSSAFARFSRDRLPGGLTALNHHQPDLFNEWRLS
jgi:hypothetical protein